ncbi:hypothetical protein [Streptomyces sp. DH37]|uniref:hypothetical protein n=1 Tax=Streptomyces sp. DH37 TaxID=3040122 RepID=UPI002442989D|nr:hypothetical protein [Streptomyces sp. DH37]MDG9701597.1 hypothetical protein [Streptomyces sp. DH37]
MRSGTGRSVASGRTIGTVPVIGALAATPAAPAGQGREDDGRGTVSTPYGPLTPTDRDFVRRVRLAGLWEPPSERRAQERGSREEAGTAGWHLIEGHTEPDRMSVDAGRALGVEPADRPGERQRQWSAAAGIDPDEPGPVADGLRLGGILVDARGRTFYRFDEDSARPVKSSRAGECLETWKPAEPAEPADGSLVEDVGPELLGTLERPGGTEQLPIDCRPPYWFTGDTGPGDVDGHGRGGAWHAVAEDGGEGAVGPAAAHRPRRAGAAGPRRR